MKRHLTKISAIAVTTMALLQGCGDGETTVVTLPAGGDEFETEALSLYAFDAFGIETMLTDIFNLPAMTAAEQTAAENLTGVKDECINAGDVCLQTARQFLHRYKTAFVGGTYTVVNQMRIVGIMGLACSATPENILRSGDAQVVAMELMHRPLDSQELSILSSAVASLPQNLQNQGLCVTLAASPEAYGQIR